MRYRYFVLAGLGLFGVTAALEHFHVGEENSPLVFGPALLGLSAIVSPLILGSSDDAPVRPSGKAVLQSVLFPILGLGLTVLGLLGAAGIVAPVSFDGPRQHCRACRTTWILKGERGDRPHYVDRCESCKSQSSRATP